MQPSPPRTPRRSLPLKGVRGPPNLGHSDNLNPLPQRNNLTLPPKGSSLSFSKEKDQEVSQLILKKHPTPLPQDSSTESSPERG
jgi:hypothetical protein